VALERNDDLWMTETERPAAHSVLRTRSFWRALYRLDVEERSAPFDLEWNVERHVFDFYVDGFSISVESAPLETLLYIDKHEAARLDECVTMPHFFRWVELKAVARFFEAEQDSPRNPSVATLLLAPFLGVTDAELTAASEGLRDELRLLRLLDDGEIDDIVERRALRQCRWIPDHAVGWRLEDDDPGPRAALRSPIYSERSGAAAFATRLLDLLRVAGVTDLDQS
jgi:hypothetical protein